MTSATKPARKPTTGPRASTGATSARTEQMRGEAFTMLLAGHKCPAIGAALGVSRQHAWKLAQEGLDLRRAETMDKAEAYRLMCTERHMGRLQKLDEIIDGKDTAGAYAYDAETRIKAAAKAKDIEAEISKLWGAYAPTRQEVTGANGAALGAPPAHNLGALSAVQLDQMHALALLAVPVEADPQG